MRQREEERGKKRVGIKLEDKKKPKAKHTKGTQYQHKHQHRSIFSLSSHPFHPSGLCSPDWLVVKLMLVYRAGKGLKDDTSFMPCTC